MFRTDRRFRQAIPLGGTTAARPDPTTVPRGTMYFDSTLAKPIWSDGADWVDATDTPV